MRQTQQTQKASNSNHTGNNRRMYNQYFKAWYTSNDGGLSWKQENTTATQSRGFSLDLIPTGKFVTVEFITKRGEISRYNGRTGVKKYLKNVQFSNAEKGNYFILWVRRGGIKFDSVAMVHKNRIVRLMAGGVVLYENKASRYSRTV